MKRKDRPAVVAESILVRAAVPVIITTIVASLSLLAFEIYHDVRLFSASKLSVAPPVFQDQIANNAMLFSSMVVSGVLVVLTYSLFSKTTEALQETHRQSDIAERSVRTAEKQADTAQENLAALKRQIDVQLAAEHRGINPFIDILLQRIVARHSTAKVWEIATDPKDGSESISARGTIEANAEEVARAQEQVGKSYLTLDALHLGLPLRNTGLGPALDIRVAVEDICWASVNLRTARQIRHGFNPRKVIFDRVGRDAFGSQNYTRDRREYRQLFLAAGEQWNVVDRAPVREVLSLDGYVTDIWEEEQLFDVAAFDSERLFGTVLGMLGRVNEEGRVELLGDRSASSSDDAKPQMELLYRRQRHQRIGIKVSISYKTLVSEERDLIEYAILISEVPNPNSLSTIIIDTHLVRVLNRILMFDETTPSPIAAAADCLAATKSRKYLFETGGFTLAGLDEVKVAVENFVGTGSIFASLPANVVSEEELALARDHASNPRDAWLALGMSPTLACSLPVATLGQELQTILAANPKFQPAG